MFWLLESNGHILQHFILNFTEKKQEQVISSVTPSFLPIFLPACLRRGQVWPWLNPNVTRVNSRDASLRRTAEEKYKEAVSNQPTC